MEVKSQNASPKDYFFLYKDVKDEQGLPRWEWGWGGQRKRRAQNNLESPSGSVWSITQLIKSQPQSWVVVAHACDPGIWKAESRIAEFKPSLGHVGVSCRSAWTAK